MENIIEQNNNTELQELRSLLEDINGVRINFDDFCNSGGSGYVDEDGLCNFGETLLIGIYIFRLKSSIDIMLDNKADNLLSHIYDELSPENLNEFQAFKLHVYECQYFPSEYDFQPSITAIQVDDKLHIVGVFNGLEV